jgi:hypothetical protein
MAADRTFSDAVEKAEGEAESRFLTQVARAATTGTWQAAAWWLERRHPDEYGRRERMDIRFDVPKEARKIAEEFGVDAASAIEEAERIIAEAAD